MGDKIIPPEGAVPLVRKLATILCADVAGYSQKMGANEERTVEIFRGHREIFESLVCLHQGRIFNTAGDALLAEFSSAVEAVRCATEIQAALRTRNDQLSSDERLLFRMGINLGDVIIQGDDLLGDGVNVAARIQASTEPGGICISGSVYDQIQNKLSLDFRPLGEQVFKNIVKPVRTYTIAEGASVTKPARRLSWRIAVSITVAVPLILGAGYLGYRQLIDRRTEQAEAESRLAIQLAEQKRAVEQAQRAAEEAKREAQIQAQKQAAEGALRQAQEERNRLEQDRRRLEAEKQAAESVRRQAAEQAQRAVEEAKREVQIQAQKQVAEGALRQVQEERNRLEQDRKRFEAEKQAAESAGRKSEIGQREAPAVTMAAASKGSSPHDGTYKGVFCNTEKNNKKTCWPATLTVRGGVMEASWKTLAGTRTARAKGTVTADGVVELKLSGWTPKGDPVGGVMKGGLVDDVITASGVWSGGFPVSGNWKRAQ